DAKRVAELEKKVDQLEAAGKYKEAQPPAREVVQIRRRVQGANHWETVDARRRQEVLKKKAALPADRQEELSQVFQHLKKAFQLMHQSRYAQAEPLLQKGLSIVRKVLGEDHLITAAGYHNLAYLLNAQGKYDRAETLNQKALAIQRKVLGEDHPRTAAS